MNNQLIKTMVSAMVSAKSMGTVMRYPYEVPMMTEKTHHVFEEDLMNPVVLLIESISYLSQPM